jgi:hypothetical protein
LAEPAGSREHATDEYLQSKKRFMHKAASILRHPGSVRDTLPDDRRTEFDRRLKEKIRRVHSPKKLFRK